MKYAVIHTKEIYHEGDERSRTNPGHGYPAYTEKVSQFTSFENEAALKNWIKMRGTDKNYTVIEYQELTVTTEIKIDLKRPVASRVS